MFWVLLTAILVLSLMPNPSSLPSTGWDKTNHLLGFLVLGILGLQAYPARTATVLAGVFLYGGLIEILQSFTPDRYAEATDLLANSLGLIAGWGLEALIRRWLRTDEKNSLPPDSLS